MSSTTMNWATTISASAIHRRRSWPPTSACARISVVIRLPPRSLWISTIHKQNGYALHLFHDDDIHHRGALPSNQSGCAGAPREQRLPAREIGSRLQGEGDREA